MTRSLISLVCVASAIALFFLYTKPTYDKLESKKQQITQYDLALDKANELQKLKQQLLSRYNSFNPTDIDRLHKLLPDHVDNVRLVLDLDTLASKHGLALQNVAISAVANTSASDQTNIIGPSTQGYDSLTLNFGTIGTYPIFLAFLTDLEQSLRIVDVVSLAMGASEGGTGEPLYRFDITLRTYWLK